VQDFVEKLFSETITEIGEGAIRRGLQKIEATEETKPGIVAEGGGKLSI
jgi:hypothetical protein